MFKWREAFSCNIAEIDKQHHHLFEVGARLHTMASNKSNYDKYDEIISILEELKQYTIQHFEYEEKLMKENNFPGYELHKMEHDFFVKKIQRIERKDLEGAQNEAVLEIISFVADWVSSHILKTDMEYKDFFNNLGIV